MDSVVLAAWFELSLALDSDAFAALAAIFAANCSCKLPPDFSPAVEVVLLCVICGDTAAVIGGGGGGGGG
ncbi:hypothetical protein, partial [Vibrio sp.]|uniref:hypothetical protein n=1 Tax=Vibrio sp. TaxID=678 RepID=UPI00311F7102